MNPRHEVPNASPITEILQFALAEAKRRGELRSPESLRMGTIEAEVRLLWNSITVPRQPAPVDVGDEPTDPEDDREDDEWEDDEDEDAIERPAHFGDVEVTIEDEDVRTVPASHWSGDNRLQIGMRLATDATPRPFTGARLYVWDDEDFASLIAVFVIDDQEVTVSLDRFFDGETKLQINTDIEDLPISQW